MAHFILVPDATDPPKAEHIELFADYADLNTVHQVADAFGVCAQTIRRLVASGDLEAVHIGRAVRITRKAMVDFIQKQGVCL